MINKLGLILGIIGLILSVIMGYMYYDNKRKAKELIAKADQSLMVLEKEAKLKEDSIVQEVRRRDSTLKSLQDAKQAAEESLNAALKVTKNLSVSLKKAKADRDTAEYYVKCDSLSEHVAVLEAENDSYQNKVDLLNLSFRKQLADKDTLLKSREDLYGKLREAFNGSALKINQLNQEKEQLNKEKEKLNVKLQRSKRTSRLVALLGVVAAGSVYITTR